MLFNKVLTRLLGKRRNSQPTRPTRTSAHQATCWWDDMSDDVLCKISSFLNNVELFELFALIHQRTYRLVHFSIVLWSLSRSVEINEKSFDSLMPITCRCMIQSIVMRQLSHEKTMKALGLLSADQQSFVRDLTVYNFPSNFLFDPMEGLLANIASRVSLYRSNPRVKVLQMPSYFASDVIRLSRLRDLKVRTFVLDRNSLAMILDHLSELETFAFEFSFPCDILSFIAERKFSKQLRHVFIERIQTRQQLPLDHDPIVQHNDENDPCLFIEKLNFVECMWNEIYWFLCHNSRDAMRSVEVNVMTSLPEFQFPSHPKLLFPRLKSFAISGHNCAPFFEHIMAGSPMIEQISMVERVEQRTTTTMNRSELRHNEKSLQQTAMRGRTVKRLFCNSADHLLPTTLNRLSESIQSLRLMFRGTPPTLFQNLSIVRIESCTCNYSVFKMIHQKIDTAHLKQLALFDADDCDTAQIEDLITFLPHLHKLTLSRLRLMSDTNVLQVLFCYGHESLERVTLDSVLFSATQSFEIDLSVWTELPNLKKLRLGIKDICFGQSWTDNMLSLTPELESLEIPIPAPQLSQVVQAIHKNVPNLQDLTLSLSWITNGASRRLGRVYAFPSGLKSIHLNFDFERTDMSDIITVLLAAIVSNANVSFNVLPPLLQPIPNPIQFIKERVDFCIDSIDGVPKSTQTRLKDQFRNMSWLPDFPECFRHLLFKMGFESS